MPRHGFYEAGRYGAGLYEAGLYELIGFTRLRLVPAYRMVFIGGHLQKGIEDALVLINMQAWSKLPDHRGGGHAGEPAGCVIVQALGNTV